jgi:hypothetical protein
MSLRSQFATLEANVSAFININVLASINNCGPKNKPEMLKVSPKFFQP